MDQNDNELLSYCRQCGGERSHSTIAEKTRLSDDDECPVYGSDTWSIVECRGCHTVTFIHSHWFSEDYELTEDGPRPIVHRDLYPPGPHRKMPEWGNDLYLGLSSDAMWIAQMHDDIYSAMGMKAYALAAMGMRAIVDFVVTSKAGEDGTFKDKLIRLEQSALTETRADILYAAFDAGSAAAHRGYSPTQTDADALLDITESLLEQFYIDPVRQRRQAEAANALKSRTPLRSKPK